MIRYILSKVGEKVFEEYIEEMRKKGWNLKQIISWEECMVKVLLEAAK